MTLAEGPLFSYVIEGWTGTRWLSGHSGLQSSTGESVTASVTMAHQAPDGPSISVTAHRPDDDMFHQLWRWAPVNPILEAGRQAARQATAAEQAAVEKETEGLARAAWDGLLTWEGVVLRVDGRPTIFLLTRFRSSWAAVGRGLGVDLTVAGHAAAVPEALVRFEEAPPTHHVPVEPPRRAHRFPDDLLRPVDLGDVPAGHLVDLVSRRRGSCQVTGTVGGVPVSVAAEIPSHEGTASGSFGGSQLGATWRLTHNSDTYPDVTGSVTGTFGDRRLSLEGVFHLDGNWGFERGAVTGALAGAPVSAQAEAVDGGLGSSYGTVKVDATVAGTELSIYAAISPDLTRALLRGHVGGRPLELDVDATGADWESQVTRIRGRYDSPPAILAIVVGTLLHFI